MGELTVHERHELERLEAVIEDGLEAFFAVGRALLRIRDERLYREHYASFEAYCRERWDIGRQHAYRLIGAAEVFANLSPIGDTYELPLNEAQARPLTALPAEAQLVAWQIVVETAPDGVVTARHVKAVAEVIRDLVNSGAIYDGDGGSVNLHDALRAAITEEHYERMMRQRQHIIDAGKPRNYLLKSVAVDWDVVRALAAALAAGRQLFVSVWEDEDGQKGRF